ncbi:MAG: hypothetical protein PHU85_15885 [Phycisphaerae bacterium]|nr:hypothetical protein [Phycisphaerae bacterium]
MIRTSMLGLVGLVALAGLLAGCQGYDLPYDQRVVAVLRETTNENPVQATLKVDGKEVFGPGDLTPGATREIVLHDPAADSARKLTPSTGHRITWRLHRSGRMNKVGSADLMIYSGTKMIKSDSTKYIMPGFWVDGWLDVKLVPSGGPAKTAPPKP